MRNFSQLVAVLIFSILLAQPLLAEEKKRGIETASGTSLTAAVGHYSRARQLLLSALKEFDAGARIASPEILIDIKEWRQSLNDRAEDLERVISPQPRVTKDGVSYPAEIKIMEGGN